MLKIITSMVLIGILMLSNERITQPTKKSPGTEKIVFLQNWFIERQADRKDAAVVINILFLESKTVFLFALSNFLVVNVEV